MTDREYAFPDLWKLASAAARETDPDFRASFIYTALVRTKEAAEVAVAEAPKVSGYTAQPDEKVRLVNEFKMDEERLLRKLDEMCDEQASIGQPSAPRVKPYDMPFLDEARSHFIVGFMLLNRAVFRPTRIKLPEDGE